MPYIETDTVKAKRQAIKKTFPKFKFSIRRQHHSSINVSILAGPINMLTNKEGRSYEQVNEFYIDDHYKDFPEVKKVLLKVYDIMKAGNRIMFTDGDYGDVPKFYTNISIGEWDKPYQLIK